MRRRDPALPFRGALGPPIAKSSFTTNEGSEGCSTTGGAVPKDNAQSDKIAFAQTAVSRHLHGHLVWFLVGLYCSEICRTVFFAGGEG